MTDLRAYQPSFTSGVLSPALWARVDLSKYSTGLKTGENIFLHAHGGASNRPGTQFITAVKNSAHKARLISFQFNTGQSYQLEFGHQYFRVIRNGGVILSGLSPYEVATPYDQAHVGDLVFTQEADVMYITHPNYPVRKLSRFADDNWTLALVTFAPVATPPTGVAAVAQVGTGTTVYTYVVSSIFEASGEESMPSLAATVSNNLTVSGNINRVSWTAVVGASRYIVYRYEGGVYGYVGGTTGVYFDDQNITPDLADTPQTGRNPFNSAGNYPRCSTFIEQRLAFASTINDPQAVWLSQSANYENFGYSQPAKASDSVTFRIKARQVNEIRSMIPLKGLMLLTSGAEILVSGGSQSDAITPSAIRIDHQGYRGAASVQPIVVGNTILFAQDRGGVIRDFSYELSNDGFVGKDLTILARHLFSDRRIKSWAYAQAPDSVVWVVLDDGSLVSLTYMKEHEVWGWTTHSSSGATFEDVSVVAEGNEDVPYFVVRRTVNGQQVRYIERLHTRVFASVSDAFFVDSGLTYSGAAATIISGLGHLEGQDVAVLADGNVVRGMTVSGGAITIPSAASKVHVGLPMVATMQTLDLDFGNVQGLGTVQGRLKSVAELTMRVENTRGVFIGSEDGDRTSARLVEYKQRSTEAWNEAIQLYTGDISVTPHWDWTDGGNMWIKQFDPLPMTILAVMPDVAIGG
jgi:hypothetical protein